MMPLTFSIPFLPPSLNVYRSDHWAKQRKEAKTWKDYIALEWAKSGKPKMKAIRIAMLFSFPDRRIRDMDNYLATGSKLVGDAVKGLFIPDDSPKYLQAWSFHFEFADKAKTTVIIEEAGKTAPNRLSTAATLPEKANTAPPVCNLSETCVAPLCPLDQISLNGVWYPDEEICRSKTHGNLPWIKAQRKIAKASAQMKRYFTLAMLKRNCIIRPGIAGLDPDEVEETQLKKWFAEHPPKREMSEDEILMRKRLAQKCLVRKGNKASQEGGSSPAFKTASES